MPYKEISKTLLKSRNILFCFISLFLLHGCSTNSSHGGITSDLFYKKKYYLEDKSGKFILIRETGMSKNKKVFTKYVVRNPDGEQKALERSIVLSSMGVYNKKYRLLRPYAHQYEVWFEKQKYSATGKVDIKAKAMNIKLTSPEEQWNKSEVHKFPDSKSGAFCFFSQIIECAKVSGFVNKSIDKNAGSMYLTLLWEGFPYIQEQYLNIPNGFFVSAVLEFDGENKRGEKRFTLKFGENAIFYFLDKNLQLTKIFWPSQGLSVVEVGKRK